MRALACLLLGLAWTSAGCAAAREITADLVAAPIASFVWVLDQVDPLPPGPAAAPDSRLPAPGSINIYRPDCSRAGYGVHRSDGSVDLFRPDGSRLGVIQPGTSGQPGRLILTPRR